ncbi:transcriptional repressor NF-X1-like [Antedon mediterranea]|uniref:transcriptional repressor NF-X1-like n=1 Tax=Antedon mediterranea TaxID=105859 RepID=UPI003AF9DB9C
MSQDELARHAEEQKKSRTNISNHNINTNSRPRGYGRGNNSRGRGRNWTHSRQPYSSPNDPMQMYDHTNNDPYVFWNGQMDNSGQYTYGAMPFRNTQEMLHGNPNVMYSYPQSVAYGDTTSYQFNHGYIDYGPHQHFNERSYGRGHNSEYSQRNTSGNYRGNVTGRISKNKNDRSKGRKKNSDDGRNLDSPGGGISPVVEDQKKQENDKKSIAVPEKEKFNQRKPNRNKFDEWNRKMENKYGRKGTHSKTNIKEKFDKESSEKKDGNKQSLESQTGTLIEQLTNQTYECMVCCDMIRSTAPTWNCQHCFAVFHIKCIKRWARSNISQLETEGELWMCPGCRNSVLKIPHVYKCFCGKMRDPPNIPGETPHTCGDVCGRKRTSTLKCPHPCNILCHPGPCPPCPATVTVHCLCMKAQQKARCGLKEVYRCAEECGKMRNCGIHKCLEICHAGDCDPCQEKVKQDCFGQHTSREVVCGGELVSIPCDEKENGIYSCLAECARELDCVFHKCKTPCHPGDCEPCQLGPKKLKRCPCSQTLLSDLGSFVRSSCRDPIPTCDKTCNKPLKCGGDDEIHLCQSKCHEGECPPCTTGISSIKCRCGNRFVDTPCNDLINLSPEEKLTCDRKCNRKMHCGRHKCQNKCCINPEHVCVQSCGRWLSCREHRCEEPCHLGNCHRCYNVSFDELYCYCGQEVMLPPIHCGVKPPPCSETCTRSHPCDHPVRHNCHSETECPPCTELCSKICMGGHEKRNNIPCYLKEFTCGNPCGKQLPCGQHRCCKRCHNDACDSEACNQPCKVVRLDCGHPCGVPCHGDQPCPKTQCKTKLTISCACGNRTDQAMCLHGGDDTQMAQLYQKLTTSNLASKIHELKSGESMDISSLMAITDGRKTRQLECNEECALIERNKRFALALQIKNPDFSSKIGPPNYTEFLKEQAKNQPQFVSSVEEAIKDVVHSAQQSKQPKRSYSFQPMNRDKRRVVHELAEFYGCQGQSYDKDPQRSVVVTASKDTCFLPSVSLMDVVQRGARKKPPPLAPTLTHTDVVQSKYTPLGSAKNLKSADEVSKKDSEKKPEITDYFDMT